MQIANPNEYQPHGPPPKVDSNITTFFNSSIPNEFDWRNYGVVTGVYNQNTCGSCWAFAATEAIESVNAIAGKGLQSLSMQQALDCDMSSSGCAGGMPWTAFSTLQGQGGQNSYAQYPYLNYQSKCLPRSPFVASVRGWKWATTTYNEQEMANNLVANGPLAVCLVAATWQYYSGGTITGNQCMGYQTDHCVTITGYSTAGQYWIIRNSWGTGWGVGGYAAVQAFTNAYEYIIFWNTWKFLCSLTLVSLCCLVHVMFFFSYLSPSFCVNVVRAAV